MSWQKPREWTKAELGQIRAEMGVKRSVDLAREIGVSLNALYKKAREIGFRRKCPKSRTFYWVEEGEELDLWPYKEGQFAYLNKHPHPVTKRKGKPGWQRYCPVQDRP
ncbi:MAG: hypothetical protein WC340_16870 [Kiritimatiellia bacterium]